MKVYINKYRSHWLSPYTVLEKVFFWREIEYDEPLIERLANILAPISESIQKFLDIIHPKINYVKIDKWDTWSMDHTLTHIILPMLKQLKETKHGSPNVDDEDVPDELKSTVLPPKDEWDIDGNHHKRWDYVLDQMIWAFEQKAFDGWLDQFHKDNEYDWDAAKAHQEKMTNGFRLFGKYYEALWD